MDTHHTFWAGRLSWHRDAACHSCSSGLLSAGSSPNSRVQTHRKQEPGTQRCQGHAHPGPAYQPHVQHLSPLAISSLAAARGKGVGSQAVVSYFTYKRNAHKIHRTQQSLTPQAHVKSYVIACLGRPLTMGAEGRRA